jgi:16S rRNA (cytosine967-C5)-methyltransferase
VSVSPARGLAHRVIGEVRTREAYAPDVLDAALKASKLDARDAALTTRLVYGTLQYLGTLDEVIDRYARDPRSVDPAVRDVLRVGAWEVLFGEGAPHAAVHQAVEAVKQRSSGAVGFANAIMRRVAGDADGFPWGDQDTDVAALARAHGHPEWLARMLLEEYGRESAVQIMVADNLPAPLYVRHNPFRGSLSELMDVLETDGARPAACDLPGCVWAGTPAAAVNGRALERGLAVVTDAAAQFATVAADPAPGSLVVEIGAGRGTKTLGLQALAVGRGGPCRLVAVDLHARKIAALQRRMLELDVPDVATVVSDGLSLAGEHEGPLRQGAADTVLVDAPCSGLGTLRRHPAKRWRVTPEDLERLADLQMGLLSSAARLVAPGGAIVYSTCTISHLENQQVTEAFLASDAGRGFRMAPLADRAPESWRHWVDDEGWFQSLPAQGGPDGHFVVRLERD